MVFHWIQSSVIEPLKKAFSEGLTPHTIALSFACGELALFLSAYVEIVFFFFLILKLFAGKVLWVASFPCPSLVPPSLCAWGSLSLSGWISPSAKSSAPWSLPFRYSLSHLFLNIFLICNICITKEWWEALAWHYLTPIAHARDPLCATRRIPLPSSGSTLSYLLRPGSNLFIDIFPAETSDSGRSLEWDLRRSSWRRNQIREQLGYAPESVDNTGNPQ